MADIELWSEEAEQAVLGAMLLDPDAVTASSVVIGEEDFYRPAHRYLFRAMHRLFVRGEPIDPVTLRDQLENDGTLQEAGGMEYIGALIDVVPDARSVAHHARIVAKKARPRRSKGPNIL